MDWIAELSFRGWDEPRVLSRCTLAAGRFENPQKV